MSYKMKCIVEQFKADNGIPKVSLECGHVKTDPLFHYGNEAAYAISRLSHAMANTQPKTRCWECAKEGGAA